MCLCTCISLGLSTNKVILSLSKVLWLLSLNLVFLICFFSLARPYSTMLKRNVERIHSCSILGEKLPDSDHIYGIHYHFLYLSFIQLRRVFPYFPKPKFFIGKKSVSLIFQTLSKYLIHAIFKMNVPFLLLIDVVCYYIDWFSDAKTQLHFWGKSIATIHKFFHKFLISLLVFDW